MFNEDETDLYKILGVSKDADDITIKKNYRKLALKFHPDRNKENKEESEQKFKKISKAYEVLSDDNKRKTYDNFGLDAVNNSGSMGGNPFDLFGNIFSQSNGFESMFNMGSSSRPNRNRNKSSPNILKKLDITLEDIYNKRKLTINFDKIIKCQQCEGSGAKDKSCIKICNNCEGSGITISIKQFGPGMISQSQTTCSLCHGIGKHITIKCLKCNGGRYETKKRKLNISLTHNTKNKDNIIIPGESNENINYDSVGDLILELNVIDHKNFKRVGDDLLITKSINLVDALCGFDLTITHLDNRKLLVKTGDIINPKTIKKISNEGFNGGDLIIHFDILFPSMLSKERKEYISKLLQINNNKKINYNEYEIKILEDYDNTFQEYEVDNNNENDVTDDNDESNIGCATQ